jgi:hypothetical protein
LVCRKSPVKETHLLVRSEVIVFFIWICL